MQKSGASGGRAGTPACRGGGQGWVAAFDGEVGSSCAPRPLRVRRAEERRRSPPPIPSTGGRPPHSKAMVTMHRPSSFAILACRMWQPCSASNGRC